MTLKEKFNSIDQSRITADQKSFLDKMKNVTKDFTLENKEVNDKVEGALDKMITSFKEKMPDAIKTTKKVVAPKNAKEKKTVVKTSGGKRTIMSVAKDIRKEGESWKDAQKRASDMLKKDKSDVSKVVESELQKLSKFIKGRKELDGLSGTDLKRDSHRTALPKGRRLSKEGNVYYENRDNRTDRLAPNYPKDAPLLELGGTVVTDLAGHTSGGDMGLNANMPLNGFSNTNYTGQVGETGAMSSGEMFANGGGVWSKEQKLAVEKLDAEFEKAVEKEGIDPYSKEASNLWRSGGFQKKMGKIFNREYELGGGLPQGTEQHYVNYYLGEGASQGIYKNGGSIPNNYEGRTPRDIWDNLTLSQRKHFLSDHSSVIKYVKRNYKGIKDYNLITDEIKHQNNDWNNLDSDIKLIFKEHVQEGQYANGGGLGKAHYISNRDISGLTTKTGQRLKGSDLLDGAYTNKDIKTPKMSRTQFEDENYEYKAGGMLNANERYVLEIKGLTGLRKEAIENYIAENNLSDNDVLNIVIGLGRKQLKGSDVASAVVGKKGNTLSKKLIEFAKENKAMKLEEGGNIDAFTLRMVKGTAGNPDEALTESKSVQFDKGGAINGSLNKKVYELASKKRLLISDWATSEYNLIMGQALVESLTSANFHEEAKQVVAKLENKKWSKELYNSEYFNPNKEVTEFADEVARICEYDGEDILNAYYFLTKMQGSKVSSVINDFLVIKKPSNAKMYILHADIKSIKVYKGSKVVTYSGKDVLNGANILKNGGGVEQKANYIAKRDVVEVELKNGETLKPANGYWIKKDAKQITEKNEDKVFIKFLNKDKKYKEDTKHFNSYEEAVKWGQANFDNFNRDMISYEYAKGGDFQSGVYADGGGVGIEEEIDLTDDKRLRVKELTYEYKKPTAKELAEKHNSGAYEFMEEDKFDYGGNLPSWLRNKQGEMMEKGKYVIIDSQHYNEKLGFSTTIGVYVNGLKVGIVQYDVEEEDYTAMSSKKFNGGVNFPYKEFDNQEDAIKYIVSKANKTTSYKLGGETTFNDKSNAIAKRFEGKRVEPKYQKEYGKVYSKDEAKEVGNKITGSMVSKEKMMSGGKTKQGNKGEAMQLAKKIRKDGEKWTDAVKRAWSQLK